MFTSKRPEVSLKMQYGKVVRVSLIGSLLALIVVFLAIPPLESQEPVGEQEIEPITSVYVPPPVDRSAGPPPKEPGIPVESSREDIEDDVTIEPTDFRHYTIGELPPPPEPDPNIFRLGPENRPDPIGGYQALMRNVRYPELAREAGVEGTVTVRAFIDKNGKVTDAFVLRGVERSGLNEAAVDAVKKTTFRPAQQRDRSVGVWINLTINFRLDQ